jgi:hypothetical protein
LATKDSTMARGPRGEWRPDDPAQAAEATGLVTSAMTVSDIVNLIDAQAPPPKPRGKYKARQPKVAA